MTNRESDALLKLQQMHKNIEDFFEKHADVALIEYYVFRLEEYYEILCKCPKEEVIND